MERLYNCDEVAERYKVKKNTVWDWIRKGILPAIRIGKMYRITQKDLDEFDKSTVSIFKEKHGAVVSTNSAPIERG